MEEPSMLAEKPSSSHFQFTGHILRSTFNHLFTQESVDTDTIRHLSASRRGKNDYHDKYVERLLQVHNKWAQSLEESQQLIDHVYKARNEARDLESIEHQNKIQEFNSYTDLGLPPVSSKLKMFIDDTKLKDYNLISPNAIFHNTHPIKEERDEDFFTPQYEISTYSSRQVFNKTPPIDCYAPKSPRTLPLQSSIIHKKSSREKMNVKREEKKVNQDIWRSCMNPLQRDIEKKDIVNLQNKADFLKNPKSVSIPKSFLNKKMTSDDERVEYFKPSPYPVVFSDYEVGMSYQVKLELKNVTASCRQVRILQPKSKHFSVSQGEFPSEDGLVAPGMSCSYTVTFTPDSFGNYGDALAVKTQVPEPMLIPLVARREPPLLSLAKNLDCGCCLVGDKKVVEYVVSNDGGNGTFCFVLEEGGEEKISWQEMDFDSNNSIDYSPFVLTPSCFKLNTGESIKVTLSFSPAAVRVFSLKLKMFCDNLTETEYTIEGKGEMPHVELSHVDGGILEPCLGETFDETASQIISFGEQYPANVCKKELHITNTISVPLQYCWKLLRPSVSPNQEDGGEVEENVFSVEPKCGCISGNSVEKFKVLFSPKKIGKFYEVISLVLSHIPVKDDHSNYVFQDQTAMKLSVKGVTQEFAMKVNPAAVIMSGDYFIGQKYHRTVSMQNCIRAPTTFVWQDIDDDSCSITFFPQKGIVGVGETFECLLTIRGKKVGDVDRYLEYDVPFSSKKHVLLLKCDFKGPNLSFIENDLSFGLVRFGTVLKRCITIRNNSPIGASWEIIDEYAEVTGSKSPYFFSPQVGFLDAESTQGITVTFSSLECKTVTDLFKCSVGDGDPSYLPVHAEVLRPQVYLKQCEIIIDEAFLDVPITKTVTLVNGNLLNAEYRWKANDDSDLDTTYAPNAGELKSHEGIDVSVQLLFHSLGDVEQYLVCEVGQMLNPIVLRVKAKVYGLKVDVTIPNIEDIKNEKEIIRNNDKLDFGINNPIGEPVDVFVMLENKSAIETNFELSAKEFVPSKVPAPPKSASKKFTRGPSSRPHITRNFSASGNPKSEDQERRGYINSILKDGNGIAFVCSPACGTLSSFETKIITVTAYANMWGEYEDSLICKIDDTEVKHIPMNIDVIGCPLNFQMCKDQSAMVRFGSHVSGDKPVIRNLKINNTSNVDIRLNWESYVVLPRDDKLIDLDVFIGNPFPTYDEKNEEIIDENLMNEPLIKVVLDEHHGQKSDVPFSILDKQVVVPGNGDATIQACIRPPVDIFEETKYLGYALGYMSLNKNDYWNPGKFKRSHGLEMIPFSLNMTGTVKPAKLHLETCDEEGFEFTLSASDLLENGELNGEIHCEKRFILSNRCDTAKEFTYDVSAPFRVTSFGDNGKQCKNKKVVLKAYENIEIKVIFEIDPHLAVTIYKEPSNQLERDFIFTFANKEVQIYKFIGQVNYPSMSIEESVLDFGVCFIGVEKRRGLTITNPSKVLLTWDLEIDPSCPLTSRSVFSHTVSSGSLEANVAGCAGSDIKFHFAPKHNVEYECVILISSQFRRLCLKEEPMRLVLRGSGSYDEAHRGGSDIAL